MSTMNDELEGILNSSLIGAVGFMWAVGGIAVILTGPDTHWALEWPALFVWAWGCGAAALHFNVKRFFN